VDNTPIVEAATKAKSEADDISMSTQSLNSLSSTSDKQRDDKEKKTFINKYVKKVKNLMKK
jgi:hemerythrin-like domain-containing protein